MVLDYTPQPRWPARLRRGLLLLFLVLIVGTVLIGIRGIWRLDMVAWGSPSQEHGVAFISGQGRFLVGLNIRSEQRGFFGSSLPRDSDQIIVELGQWLIITGDNGSEKLWSVGGFVLGYGDEDYRFVMFGLPYWFVGAAAFTPVAIAWLRRRRRLGVAAVAG